MTSVFENIQKRSASPVPGLSGVFVREITYGESRRVRALSGDDLRSAFVIGSSVVGPAGDREWDQPIGETDAAYAARILMCLDSLTPSTIKAISDEIERLTKPVNLEKLEKKSPAITSPDSPVTSPPE
jgi:hypothetical protein